MAPDSNGGKLVGKLSGVAQSVSSIVSVVVVLIGLVVWSARQEGRIGELEHRMVELEQRGTRTLAEKTSVISEHVDALNAAQTELQKRLEQFNSAGSQAGLILAERVANDERQEALTRERVQALGGRDEDFAKRIGEIVLMVQKLDGRIDVLENEVRHIKNGTRP